MMCPTGDVSFLSSLPEVCPLKLTRFSVVSGSRGNLKRMHIKIQYENLGEAVRAGLRWGRGWIPVTAYSRHAKRSFLSLSPSVEYHGTGGIVSFREVSGSSNPRTCVCDLNWESGLHGWNLVKTKSSSHDWGPARRGKCRHGHTGRGSVMTGQRWACMLSPSWVPRECHRPPEAGSQKKRERASVGICEGNVALLTCGFQASTPWVCERRDFCCWKARVLVLGSGRPKNLLHVDITFEGGSAHP